MVLDYYNALGGVTTISVLQNIYPPDILKKILSDIRLWSTFWGIIIIIPSIYFFFSAIQGNYYDLFIFILSVIFGYYILKPKYEDYKRLKNLLK